MLRVRFSSTNGVQLTPPFVQCVHPNQPTDFAVRDQVGAQRSAYDPSWRFTWPRSRQTVDYGRPWRERRPIFVSDIAPYRKPFELASERSHFRVGDFPSESCIEPRNLRPVRSRRKMEACPDLLVCGRTAGLPSISTGCSLALADLSKQPGVRS